MGLYMGASGRKTAVTCFVWLSQMWHSLAEEDVETKEDVFFHTKLYVLLSKAVSAGEHIFSSVIKGGLIATVISAARHWCRL